MFLSNILLSWKVAKGFGKGFRYEEELLAKENKNNDENNISMNLPSGGEIKL